MGRWATRRRQGATWQPFNSQSIMSPYIVSVSLFQMPLWILAAMQDTDDFNSVRGHTVKQGVAFYREAPGARQELWALGSY